MAMLTSDHPKTESRTPAPVIDLSYLRQHSFGNPALEAEMLELFLRQSMRLLLEFGESTEPHEWRGFARTLKSSALGIGALEVAELAAQLETRSQARGSAETSSLLARLETAILKVNDCIRSHLKNYLTPAH